MTEDTTPNRETDDRESDGGLNLPEFVSERRWVAERLYMRVSDDPDEATERDVLRLVALLDTNDRDVRLNAVEAIQELHHRPELFDAVIDDLVSFAAVYPPDVEGIPKPVRWMSDSAVREVVYVADSLFHIARERPEAILPVADRLFDIIEGDQNYPCHHIFTLGYVGASYPESVPLSTIVDELCSLLDRGHSNGYPPRAAETLGQIGDPAVLPQLREHRPDDWASNYDRRVQRTFDEAIEALERVEKEEDPVREEQH